MKLHGLNKITLLDYPGHLACTVFTGGCNFRCPFCQNAPLVLHPADCPVISEDVLFSYLKKRQGMLEGVCITGGEPTLQPDLIPFLERIRSLGYLIKLDTNGYRPEVLKELLKRRLPAMVSMDIKNAPARYAATVGLLPEQLALSDLEESIRLLLHSGIPCEFRTTVVRELHTAEDFVLIAEWISSLGSTPVCTVPYFLQSFVASEQLICQEPDRYHAYPKEQLLHFVGLLRKTFPNAGLRGEQESEAQGGIRS